MAQAEDACALADLQHRAALQNKLAGACEDMCKEVGAFPNCAQCPDFVEPDSTPDVETWEELLDRMEVLESWGHDQLKEWRKTAAALIQSQPRAALLAMSAEACAAEDLKRREQVQNKLIGACEDMCKEVGAYPSCAECPDFVEPDATPNVMTWPELYEKMDSLEAWGQEKLKTWRATAAR